MPLSLESFEVEKETTFVLKQLVEFAFLGFRKIALLVVLVGSYLIGSAAVAADFDEISIWHSYRAGEAEALEKCVNQFRERNPEAQIRQPAWS